MVFVSVNDLESSKVIKKLLTDELEKSTIILDRELGEDCYGKMKNSSVIISDLNLSTIKFALSENKRIVVILSGVRKLSKSERELLKNKKVYCCKSEKQAVSLTKYLIDKVNFIKFSLVISVLALLGLLVCTFIIYRGRVKQDNTKSDIVNGKIDYKMENIVFIGDSITYFYDLSKYYKDLPVINSGIGGYRTDDLYNTLKEKLYVFNPTKVFLMIGTNDFLDDKSDKDIINKIEEIVYAIHDNRPNAHIYLESIYPVNNTNDKKIDKKMVHDRNNKRIKSINKKLKLFCKEEKLCTYIDMYSVLVDNDGNLKLDYTNEGLHISDKGYEVITNMLMPYIERVEK